MLKQNGHADIIRGFLLYMNATSPHTLSKATVQELEQISKENDKPSINPSFLQRVNNGEWNGLTETEMNAFKEELSSLPVEVSLWNGCDCRHERRR